jgi:hypothetical protein
MLGEAWGGEEQRGRRPTASSARVLTCVSREREIGRVGESEEEVVASAREREDVSQPRGGKQEVAGRGTRCCQAATCLSKVEEDKRKFSQKPPALQGFSGRIKIGAKPIVFFYFATIWS